jgi:hypothetical protein
MWLIEFMVAVALGCAIVVALKAIISAT